MITVPGRPVAEGATESAPTRPSPTLLLMAAATMHEQGRLIQKVADAPAK